jgi:PHD and RING finger domain-containing protein 1
VDNNSDGDSVKCPVCSVTFTTQEVATPDTCDHTFCAACLQELSQNENNCPVDKRMFNCILVRHHLHGEIITRIPVEPTERQGECNREDASLCVVIR